MRQHLYVDFVRSCEYNEDVFLRLCLVRKKGVRMDYLSVKQVSELWGISKRRIQTLCTEKRIPGAMRVGSYWAIPANAEKPKDERVKSGKYIKQNVLVK